MKMIVVFPNYKYENDSNYHYHNDINYYYYYDDNL